MLSSLIIDIISLWGILFYLILGLCYLMNPGILLQDLNRNVLYNISNQTLFTQEIYKQYQQLAMNCFLSVLIYLILFFSSLFLCTYQDLK